METIFHWIKVKANSKIDLIDSLFPSVAYKFGCSLSTIRREWRNIDPDVRRGQWQVDEDEVQIKVTRKNWFRLFFRNELSTIDSYLSFFRLGSPPKCIETIESGDNQLESSGLGCTRSFANEMLSSIRSFNTATEENGLRTVRWSVVDRTTSIEKWSFVLHWSWKSEFSCFLARWSQIQLAFPGRSCYTLQNRYRKLMQFRQINELFNGQQVFFCWLSHR